MSKRIGLATMWVVCLLGVVGAIPGMAKEVTLLGRPLTVLGYGTQGVGVSLASNDYYDTERGFQTALMNLFVEGDYKATNNLKFYTSGKATVDWAYQIKANDSSWHDKEFDKSRDRLNFDHNYWQIVNEAHLGWSPGNFFFRLGKQLVSWGETDGFRLMDQICPADGRRGFADVEWENTVIPTWLLRAEYYPRITTKWLQDLAIEFIFNFNADHIYNQDIALGNDVGGLWAPNIRIPDPTAPMGELRVGSDLGDIQMPRRFNYKGYEYALRIKGIVYDTIVTLNGFYGFDNSPIVKFADPANPFPVATTDPDGKLILHPNWTGKYPRFRFVGVTASRDIPIKVSALGNVAPIFRLETFYAFNNTFSDALTTVYTPDWNKFKTFDEFRIALGVDWKIKIPMLNQRAYFAISPQVYLRRVDISGQEDWYDTAQTRVGKYNWTTSLFISTMYLNAKLTPSFFWLHDQEYGSDFFRLQATYDWSENWRVTLGSLFFNANALCSMKANNSFDLFTNKSQIFFKLTYKWS